MLNFTRYQLIAACAIAGIALIGMVVFAARSGVFGGAAGSDIKFIESDAKSAGPKPRATKEAPPGPEKICIHIAGRVRKPGVYDLDPDSRVIDAIKAAGGALESADLESINLAEKLTDGEQVYIAPRGKVPPPAGSMLRGSGAAPAPVWTSRATERMEKAGPEKLTTPGQRMVNINAAGPEELQRLPGIGPSMAQRIIDYRMQHGRFQSIEELDEVRGIGPATIEKLRPFVSL